MDTRLMELLACPICKGPLQLDAATRQLVCTADRLGFEVRDGIAVMLENEARHIDSPADTAPQAAGL
ncbi:MAG: hypothetical protein RL722_1760 [Pseudomonadota bacterium]|jgi:uncharacterized protein YbaR (Trm112 family)